LKQAEQIATPSQKTQSSEVDEMTMQSINASVLKFFQDEDGLTVVEYAVAGGLVSAAVVAAFTLLGGNVNTVIGRINTALNP
jgi:pilus assembly protein Flp/PilA